MVVDVLEYNDVVVLCLVLSQEYLKIIEHTNHSIVICIVS